MQNPNSGNRTDAIVRGDIFDGIIEQAKNNSDKNYYPEQVWDYPETLVDLLKCFLDIWLLPEGSIPSKKQKSKYENWILQLEKLNKLFSSSDRMKLAMKYSYDKYQKSKNRFIVYEPASIYKIVVDGISELRQIEKKQKQKLEGETKVATPEQIKGTVKNLKKLLEREDD